MCLNDGRVANRLMRRRVGLTAKFSNELSSPAGGIQFNRLQQMNGSDSVASNLQPPVWVDGEIIRRFLSCDRSDLSAIIPPTGPVLQNKHLLCEHGTGLHPRVARKGKLLPRPLYDALVSLMLGERRLLNDDDQAESMEQLDEADANDCIITPDNHMYCEICAESYKADLRQKMDCLDRLRQLANVLGQNPGGKIEFDYESSSDEEGNESEDFVYLVSTKFVSKLKALVNGIVKNATDTEIQSQGKKKGSTKADAYCEGLDSIDLSEFFDTDNSSGELDHFVNMAITCKL